MSIERLYKYGCINEYSEQLFSGSTIWQASAASLNDPFECTPSFVFTHEPDKIMAQLVRTLRKNNPSLKRLTKSQVVFLAESGLDSIECLHQFRAGVLAER